MSCTTMRPNAKPRKNDARSFSFENSKPAPIVQNRQIVNDTELLVPRGVLCTLTELAPKFAECLHPK
eukprot:6180008-Pleurochrysis_carterae.AAC.4